jgi:hypothetical protein
VECQLVLVKLFWFVVKKNIFLVAKNTLQLFLSFSTMFYSQDVIKNIVAKGGIFY